MTGGMYNLVFGEGAHARILVALLAEAAEDRPFDIGRYRDAWVERHGDMPLIRVHTRNGGNNRADYPVEIESMQAHPWYHHDEDMGFDNTYADFYFLPQGKLGAELIETLMKVAINPVDMPARWDQAIKALGDERPNNG